MRFKLVACLLVGLCSTVPAAVVTVNVDRVTVSLSDRDQVVPLEVYATNPGASENERLDAYTIMVEAPTFRPDGGAPRFVLPPASGGTYAFDEPVVHPYVFRRYPGDGPVDPASLSDFNTVLLSAAMEAGDVNIADTDFNGFARVSVLVPADTPAGLYLVNVQPQFLSLGGAGAPIIALPGTGWVMVGPEPGCAGLLAMWATLALRRRPRA